MTRLMLPMSALILSLLLTSCGKDDPEGANNDALRPDSPEGVDSASKPHEGERVEFDGFVNISSPISDGVSHEGMVTTESGIEIVVINESGIERPAFPTSKAAVTKKPIQGGEPPR